MNDVKIFNNADFGNIRMIMTDNEPWFIGKDVASALGYKDTADALKRHVDEDDKLTRCFALSGQNRNMYIINESGLYSLILSSKLEKAKLFKRWVTNEILPSIRKNGMYATDELLNNPDLLIQVATQLKDEREQRRLLEEQHNLNKPKILFAESVESSRQSILVGDLAKLIKQNGYDIGQNRLFDWLRENEYLISRKGDSYNMPTQKSMNMKLFEVKESTHINPDGSTRITKTPKVTGKGQIYFINKFLRN